MDISQFAGGDFKVVTIGGIDYKIGELSLRDWAPVQAHIKATATGPLALMGRPEYQSLPAPARQELRASLIQLARTSWPPQVGSKEWFFALDEAPGGQAVFLKAALGKLQPSITDEGAAAIAAICTIEDVIPIVMAAMGIEFPKAETPPSRPAAGETGGAATPKAPGRPTTSAKSRTSSRAAGDGRGTTSST